MRSDELGVRAATEQDANFIAALRANPDTASVVATPRPRAHKDRP